MDLWRETPAISLTLHSFGGFEYGYQQGVLGQSLVMYRFKENFPNVVSLSKVVLFERTDNEGCVVAWRIEH